jgi:hypothetical protein
VIEFLRYPSRTGEFLKADDGYTLLRWDHLSDVEYEVVDLIGEGGTRERINLTFLKPLVHRRNFFPEYYHIPQTYHDLLKTKSSNDVRLVVSFDSNAKNIGMKKYSTLTLEGISQSSILCGFENESMGIYDIALLVECEQIIDVDNGFRHDVEVAIEVPRNINLPDLSEYPRIHNVIISAIEDDYQEEEIEKEYYDEIE